jgi:hypothetical protein
MAAPNTTCPTCGAPLGAPAAPGLAPASGLPDPSNPAVYYCGPACLESTREAPVAIANYTG